MKIEGLLNDEEQEEVKKNISIMQSEQTEIIESGFLGTKVSDDIGDNIMYDVYRIIAVVTVKKKSKKSTTPKKAGHNTRFKKERVLDNK